MARTRINYGKIVLVTFITILIWVWADKTQDRLRVFPNVPIKADRFASPDLWVTFEGNKSQFVIEKLTLKGPASRLEAIGRRRESDLRRLEFHLSPAMVGLTEPGTITLNIPDFLHNSGQLRDLGVTAVDSEPALVNVTVSRLAERELKVRVVRRDNSVLEAKSIVPQTVTMRVPQDWGPDKLVADVMLNESEIAQARGSDFEKPAQVRFSADEVQYTPVPIKVTLPPAEEELKPYTITQATIGYVWSPNLEGKYTVKLENYSELATFTISATPEAERAYREQPFQILLYILDEDARKAGELRKEVVYNFPDEFVESGKIKLNQSPDIARFKLLPLEVQPGTVLSP